MQQLLGTIERHITDTGVPQTRFGRDAVGDPRLVGDLRNGREPKPETSARILAFITANGPPTTSPACTALLAALKVKAQAGFTAEARSEQWRCGILAGERHRLTLRFAGWHKTKNVDRLLDGLSNYEFALPGLLVADIVVDEPVATTRRSTATLEALTLKV